MEPGIYLLKQEFGPMIGISNNQIDRRKAELYKWLYNFYDYEILDGYPIRIKINEVIGEYQPLPRKKYNNVEREAKVSEALKDYELSTIAALGTEFKPNSKAKIARDAIVDFGYERYSHTNQEAVAKRFVKPAFDVHAETNNHMVWVDCNNYEVMTEEELSCWKQILSDEQMDEEQRANAFDRMMQGEDISKEKQYYKNAIKRFKEEFDFVPVHVREWKIKKNSSSVR